MSSPPPSPAQEPTPTKEKKGRKPMNSIMDAVSALTSLGDEDESESGSNASTSDPNETKAKEEEELPVPEIDKTNAKRYIPEHKKPDAALTFPEKLMNMMRYANEFKDDENFCVGWLPDGNTFVIRNPDNFTRKVLPKFFKATKFQSFTRKLYRWGFRQVNRGIGPDDPIIFGNEFFQRDNEELMVKMRSTTAAGTRKAQNGDMGGGRKRSLEELDQQRKRIMFERFMQEKAMSGAFMTGPDGQGFPGGMMRPNFMNGMGFPGGMMMPNRFGFSPEQMQMMQQQGQGQEQDQQQQGSPQEGESPNHRQQPSPEDSQQQQQQGTPEQNAAFMYMQQQQLLLQQQAQMMQQQSQQLQEEVQQQQQAQQQQAQQQMNGGGKSPGNESNDIVNAAINALRYAA